MIDNLGGIRAWLNSAIREVYRRKANDPKFVNDISVKHTITISGGTGTLPDEVFREYLLQSQITDTDSSLVSFQTYSTDVNDQNYDQLGYAWVVGDTINYKAPSPDFSTYSGSLYVTVPSFPELPASMDDNIEFASAETIDDVVSVLALSILGKESYEVISA